MDRYDFYFKQPVSQAEFDGAFDAVEHAIWNQVKDRGIYGIVSGFAPTAPGAWSISFSTGLGIDKNGARLRSTGTITQSIALDTAGVSTTPAPGNRRWISIFARFGRDLSDPRTDGLGAPIKFSHAEALNPDDTQPNVGKLFIVAGVEDLITDPVPARPALDAAAILLADILLTDGDVALTQAMISTSRAERLGTASGWDHSLLGNYDYVADPAASQYVQMFDVPASNNTGVGTNARTRVYASTAGLCIVNNAKWQPEEQTWLKDTGSFKATKILLSYEGMFFFKRSGASPFPDVDGPTGWDSKIEFVMPTANSLLTVDPATDMVSKGTQRVYWCINAVTAAAIHAHQVQFPKKFAATPSSVTFSTTGMAADYVNGTTPTITITAPNVHPNGAMILASWSVASGTGDTLIAERDVIATY